MLHNELNEARRQLELAEDTATQRQRRQHEGHQAAAAAEQQQAAAVKAAVDAALSSATADHRQEVENLSQLHAARCRHDRRVFQEEQRAAGHAFEHQMQQREQVHHNAVTVLHDELKDARARWEADEDERVAKQRGHLMSEHETAVKVAVDAALAAADVDHRRELEVLVQRNSLLLLQLKDNQKTASRLQRSGSSGSKPNVVASTVSPIEEEVTAVVDNTGPLREQLHEVRSHVITISTSQEYDACGSSTQAKRLPSST